MWQNSVLLWNCFNHGEWAMVWEVARRQFLGDKSWGSIWSHQTFELRLDIYIYIYIYICDFTILYACLESWRLYSANG